MTMECLTRLIGIRELCSENTDQPLFFLDDAEGVDRTSLGQIAKQSIPSGKEFGLEIIDSAARFLMADIESLIPKGYSIKSSLNSFCNVCTYSSVASSQPFTGVVVKNISTSKASYLSIDSLKVMTGITGSLTVVLDDGISPKVIPESFTAGVEKQIININFKTISRYVKIYFLEADVLVKALSCPVSKSCGCSGQKADKSTDITVKGLLSNAEFTTQYGFIPCASVVCSTDTIICNIVNQQPRLFGLALFYRSAARYYSEIGVTQRLNKNASFDKEDKRDLAAHYEFLYYERLRGSQNVKGIADNMAAVLNNIPDPCIECTRRTSIAWAVS